MTLDEEIVSAFSDLERPSPTTIATASCDRPNLEALAVQEFFAPLLWTEVDIERLYRYKGDKSSCLLFMSESAFLYYFPAYLRMILVDTAKTSALLLPVLSLLGARDQAAYYYELMQLNYDIDKCRCIVKSLYAVDERFVKLYGGIPVSGPRPNEIAEIWKANLTDGCASRPGTRSAR